MPIYDMKCSKCGYVEEILFGISEAQKIKQGHNNLSKLHIKCSNCKNTIFEKQVTAHGKTPVNWASWQDKPTSK